MRSIAAVAALGLLAAVPAATAVPVGTTFTYQGELTDAGAPVAGLVDLRFSLHDDSAAGALVGAPVQLDAVPLAGGRFTVELDFGDVWDGNARWIEVEVRSPHDPADALPFTTLAPRQPLTAAPYAQHAENGNWRRSGSAILNENPGFVGINRDYPVGSEWFGVHAPVQSGYGGMYVTTEGALGQPFYGYHTGTERGWHYIDGTDGSWKLDVDGTRLTVTDTGEVGIGTTAPTEKLQVAGTIESTTGGFKFPDGTVQSTASAGAGDGHSLDASDGDPVDAVAVDAVGNASVAVRLGVGTSPSYKLDVRDPFAGTNAMNLERQSAGIANSDMLQIEGHVDADDLIQFIECERGSDVKFRIFGNGNVTADGTFSGGGADFAEIVKVTGGAASVEPGDVMVVDPGADRGFAKSAGARSTLVAGVYSTNPGFLGSEHDWDRLATEIGLAPLPRGEDEEAPALMPIEIGRHIDEVPLAVVGIVPCKVSAENGPITPGDLLVTASRPGHAMRDDEPRAGTIVGKSLGSLASGTGVVKILVTLQ